MKLKCKVCDGTDFINTSDSIQCQGCGLKYSISDAQSLMVNDEDEANDNVTKSNYENLCTLAKSAIESNNSELAYNYANKLLEIEPQKSDGWLYKCLSIDAVNILYKQQYSVIEMIQAGENAISYYSPSDITADIATDIYFHYFAVAVSMLTLALDQFRDTKDLKEYFKLQCNIDFFSAARKTQEFDGLILGQIDTMQNIAIKILGNIPQEFVEKSQFAADSLISCSKLYSDSTEAFKIRVKVYNRSITSEAIDFRSMHSDNLRNRGRLAHEKYDLERENEQKLKNEEFWKNHSEEKNKLETIKVTSEKRIKSLQKSLFTTDNCVQYIEISARIDSIGIELKNLSVFKRKERNLLSEQLSTKR